MNRDGVVNEAGWDALQEREEERASAVEADTRQEVAAFRGDLGYAIVSSHEDYQTAFHGEYAEAFGRLWVYFLKLQGCSPWHRPHAENLDVSVCLRVCDLFDPQMSPAGVGEMLVSLGMSTTEPQRVSEKLFAQWMAVMFAGCDDEALEEGIACMLEAVTAVLAAALAG